MRIEQLRQIAEIKKQRSISMAARQLLYGAAVFEYGIEQFRKGDWCTDI